MFTQDYVHECPPQLRKRLKNRPKISNDEILQIAHRVIIEHEKQAEVAREFRITSSRVSQIVCKVLKNKNLFAEM